MAENENGGERSEDPTQKRLDEALERGDVVKSQEVSTWFVIAGATLVLLAFSSQMSGGLQTSLRGILANAHDIPMDGRGLLHLTGRLGGVQVRDAVAGHPGPVGEDRPRGRVQEGVADHVALTRRPVSEAG